MKRKSSESASPHLTNRELEGLKVIEREGGGREREKKRNI